MFKSFQLRIELAPVAKNRRTGPHPPELEITMSQLGGDIINLRFGAGMAARYLLGWLGAYAHGGMPEPRVIQALNDSVAFDARDGGTALVAAKRQLSSRVRVDPSGNEVPRGVARTVINRVIAKHAFAYIAQWLEEAR